ncbi:penicillin-binding protein OB-like domain-containing protein [Ditylenchus destructor]|uniref:Penicillin-binding protein OB-like domain-containing protein n=1 Tax=Ditylenchus destructor TaxID=166010 RepID=A0AAD4MFL9_9BILA|nr:penicillin-binding protein OB-like domain-containing protein [Ditylenchus destructor]
MPAACGSAPPSIPRSRRRRRRPCATGCCATIAAPGWSGPMREAAFEGDSWRAALLNTNINLDYEDWRAAIVISKSGGSAELGFGDGRTGTLPASGAQMPVRGQSGTAFNALKPGDVIAVAPEGGVFALRSIPKVSGG